MTLTLIAALDEDDAIGRSDGGLPWHLPDESAHFRAACAGKWLLVGRRTFEEMDGWFQQDHRIVVLTRHLPPIPAATGTTEVPRTAGTVPEALALARQAHADEIMVIGGARTYAAALPFADRLVLSRIGLRSGASVRFPPVDRAEWSLVQSQPTSRDAATGVEFSIQHWERRCNHPPQHPSQPSALRPEVSAHLGPPTY